MYNNFRLKNTGDNLKKLIPGFLTIGVSFEIMTLIIYVMNTPHISVLLNMKSEICPIFLTWRNLVIALLSSKPPTLTLARAQPPRCAWGKTCCVKMKGQQNPTGFSHTFLVSFAISRSFGGPLVWNKPIRLFSFSAFQWRSIICPHRCVLLVQTHQQKFPPLSREGGQSVHGFLLLSAPWRMVRWIRSWWTPLSESVHRLGTYHLEVPKKHIENRTEGLVCDHSNDFLRRYVSLCRFDCPFMSMMGIAHCLFFVFSQIQPCNRVAHNTQPSGSSQYQGLSSFIRGHFSWRILPFLFGKSPPFGRGPPQFRGVTEFLGNEWIWWYGYGTLKHKKQTLEKL